MEESTSPTPRPKPRLKAEPAEVPPDPCDAERVPVKHAFAPRQFEKVNQGHLNDPEAISVQGIMKENLRGEPAYVPPPRPRKRRGRTQEYLLSLLLGNGAIILIANLTKFLPALFALAGMAIFTAGVTWLMFGVLDKKFFD
jgi:hypothetical protein